MAAAERGQHIPRDVCRASRASTYVVHVGTFLPHEVQALARIMAAAVLDHARESRGRRCSVASRELAWRVRVQGFKWRNGSRARIAALRCINSSVTRFVSRAAARLGEHKFILAESLVNPGELNKHDSLDSVSLRVVRCRYSFV
jgi:hypothetical protein